MKILLTAAAALAATVTLATPAAAATTVTFQGLANQVAINNFYNGGTASNGTSGNNYGISFSGFNSFVGSNGGSETIGYNAASTAFASMAAGFSSLSFQYGFLNTGTVKVYSGLNGTGTLLGSATFLRNINTTSGAFTSGSVAFSGVARSFSLGSASANLALDNITFGSAVPEPATWAMMMVGFAAIGIALRRRGEARGTIRFA